MSRSVSQLPTICIEDKADSVCTSVALVTQSSLDTLFREQDFTWIELEETEATTVMGGVVSSQADAPQPSPLQPKTTGDSEWSESIHSLLEQPPAVLPQRLIAAGLIFGCLASIWACFGKVEEASHAQGRLIPEGQVYKVQSAVSGEVKQLFVKEGQKVEKQQIIASLDHRLTEKEVERLQHSLDSDQLKRLQTKVLIQQVESELQALDLMSIAEIQAKQSEIAQIQTQTDTQQQLLKQLQAETDAHEARMARLKPLVSQGALSEDVIFQVEQALRERLRSVTENQGAIKQSQSEVSRLQSELAGSKASKQKQEFEARQRLQELEITAEDLEAKIVETKALLSQAKTAVGQRFLRAPVSGIISSLKIGNRGEVAQPGQTIAEVAPQGMPLVLSALLPSREAGLVKVGMPVKMKFDAFPYQNYGVISGKILSISPDAEVNNQTGVAYRVDVVLNQDYVMHEEQKMPFQIGQTATAEIIVRERRIIDVVLDPIRQMQKGDISL